MKIGIVTFHNVYNYGGMLQAYALCKYLNTQNHDCVCINYQQPTLKQKYTHKLWDSRKSAVQNAKHFVSHYLLKKNVAKEKAFDQFLKQHIPLTKEVDSLQGFQKLVNEFDVLISGSDQLWNPIFTGGKLDPVYFLHSGGEDKKLAYASSAGAYEYSADELQQLKTYLSSYQRIAVREEFLQKQLQKVLADVAVVLDPTLLLSRENWLEIAVPIAHLPEKYILLYTFDNDKESIRTADAISKKTGWPIVSLFRVKTDVKIHAVLDHLGPQQFLHLVENCSFVVTNSFHGTAFAINFKKNFFSIYKKSNPHRVLNLVSRVSLAERVIHTAEDLPEVESWELNYDLPSNLLEEERAIAKTFLEL